MKLVVATYAIFALLLLSACVLASAGKEGSNGDDGNGKDANSDKKGDCSPTPGPNPSNPPSTKPYKFNKCVPSYCDGLSKYDDHKVDQVKPKEVGDYIGDPSAGINVAAFDSINSDLLYQSDASPKLSHCCRKCAHSKDCAFFYFFLEDVSNEQAKSNGNFREHNKKCYLASVDRSKPKFAEGRFLPPVSLTVTGSKDGAIQDEDKLKIAFVGGKCNTDSSDDPHMVGAHGTPFDFNGQVGQTYCLLADKDLQVNVMMKGYHAPAGELHPLRTWIEEVGLLWNTLGQKHALYMKARSGKRQARGADGFLAFLSVDDQEIAAEARTVGSVLDQAGTGLTVSFLPVERQGRFEVDHFQIAIDGLVALDVRMRVAHPLLQTETEAHAHFNVGFDGLSATPAIHGVLGQTYRETAEQIARAEKFSELSKRETVFADRDNGKAFLDGTPEDYITSGILSGDCKFSSFVEAA